MSIKLITRGLMMVIGLMILHVAKSGSQNTIPYSASETVTTDGTRCINSFSQPDLVLACFMGIVNAVSTDTLKSRFLETYGKHFVENKHHTEAKTAARLAEFYRKSAKLDPQKDATCLRNEIDKLEESKEYTRTLNLLFKFKDPELSSLHGVIAETVTRIEDYAKTKLKYSTYAHDIIEAHQLLTQIYLLTDNFHRALEVTTQAMDLLIFHNATNHFPRQFEYFQAQHGHAQKGLETKLRMR